MLLVSAFILVTAPHGAGFPDETSGYIVSIVELPEITGHVEPGEIVTRTVSLEVTCYGIGVSGLKPVTVDVSVEAIGPAEVHYSPSTIFVEFGPTDCFEHTAYPFEVTVDLSILHEAPAFQAVQFIVKASVDGEEGSANAWNEHPAIYLDTDARFDDHHVTAPAGTKAGVPFTLINDGNAHMAYVFTAERGADHVDIPGAIIVQPFSEYTGTMTMTMPDAPGSGQHVTIRVDPEYPYGFDAVADPILISTVLEATGQGIPEVGELPSPASALVFGLLSLLASLVHRKR
jgi:hypothetical protein